MLGFTLEVPKMNAVVHKVLSAFGLAAVTTLPVIATQYQGNWKVAIGCLFASTFLGALGFTAAKPLFTGKGGDQ